MKKQWSFLNISVVQMFDELQCSPDLLRVDFPLHDLPWTFVIIHYGYPTHFLQWYTLNDAIQMQEKCFRNITEEMFCCLEWLETHHKIKN